MCIFWCSRCSLSGSLRVVMCVSLSVADVVSLDPVAELDRLVMVYDYGSFYSEDLGTNVVLSIWACPLYILYCAHVFLLLPFTVSYKEKRCNKIQCSISLRMHQLLLVWSLVSLKNISQFCDLFDMQKALVLEHQIFWNFFQILEVLVSIQYFHLILGKFYMIQFCIPRTGVINVIVLFIFDPSFIVHIRDCCLIIKY